jgi:hypothetical protein
MNIDERLEFLRQSTESLHASCQELHAASARQAELGRQHAEEIKRLDARERKARSAMLDGISAYLRALSDENGGNNAEA